MNTPLESTPLNFIFGGGIAYFSSTVLTGVTIVEDGGCTTGVEGFFVTDVLEAEGKLTGEEGETEVLLASAEELFVGSV